MDAVISLGGSMIVPDAIDVDFLKKFRQIILDFIAEGNRAVIVSGGGSTARKYQEGVRSIIGEDNEALDWMGISATHLNAFLMRCIFNEESDENIINNPESNIDTDKNVILAGGWKPGNSTDLVAVKLAENLGITDVINLTNIDYVCSEDPKKNPDAEKIEVMDWERMISIVGTEWIPGANFPFDPVASKVAADLNLKVVIMNGNDLSNLDNFLKGKSFKGTTIHNE